MPWSLRRGDGAPVDIVDVVTIGRDPACDLCLPERAVSRVHCRVRLEPEGPVLENASKFGTVVNGAKIEHLHDLEDGDVIQLGEHAIHVARARRTAFWPGTTDEATAELPADDAPEDDTPHFSPHAPTGARNYTLELIDDPSDAERRYHDAVALDDHGCLAVLIEVMSAPPRSDTLAALAGLCKEAVRHVAKRGAAPDHVLELCHTEAVRAGVKAHATCVRLDVRKRVVLVSSAGPSPPRIVRATGRVANVQLPPTTELGVGRTMRFEVRAAHFDHGDTLLIPSEAWTPVLTVTLQRGVPEPGDPMRWLRALPPVTGGTLLCLTRT